MEQILSVAERPQPADSVMHVPMCALNEESQPFNNDHGCDLSCSATGSDCERQRTVPRV